jgi:hypothetical protein
MPEALRLASFFPTSKKEAWDVQDDEEQSSGQFKGKGSASHCVLGARSADEELSTDSRSASVSGKTGELPPRASFCVGSSDGSDVTPSVALALGVHQAQDERLNPERDASNKREPKLRHVDSIAVDSTLPIFLKTVDQTAACGLYSAERSHVACLLVTVSKFRWSRRNHACNEEPSGAILLERCTSLRNPWDL